MELSNFLSKVEQSIEQLTAEEMRLWMRDYARRLPVEQRQMFLDSFYRPDKQIDINKIDKQMLWASDWLDEIEEGNRVIYYVTASDWWDEFEIDDNDVGYEDREGIIPELKKVLNIIESFVMQYQFEDAAELLHRLFHLEVVEKIIWFYDQTEIDENIIPIDSLFSSFHLDINYFSYLWMYVTVQLPSESKNDRLFEVMSIRNVTNIEVIQRVGPTELNVDLFIDDWITYLVQKKGPKAYLLLENAIQSYKSVDYLEENLGSLTVNHPQLYLYLLTEKLSLSYTNNEFEPLELKRQIHKLSIHETDKIKKIIQMADNMLDDKLILGSEIMEVGYEISKLEENLSMQAYYRKRAFQFRSSIVNFLRLRLYLDSDEFTIFVDHWESLPKKKFGSLIYYLPQDGKYLEYNELSTEEELARVFFTEKFTTFFTMCKNEKDHLGWRSNILGFGVPLFLLLLNKEAQFTPTMSALIPYVTNLLIYSNRDLHNFTEEFKVFRKTVHLTESLEKDILDWLSEVIANRTEVLLAGQYRNSYYHGVELLLAHGEVLESRGIVSARAEMARIYRKRYSRFRRFIQELNERI